MMKVEDPLDKEHRQEAAEQPPYAMVDVLQLEEGVRQQMQDAHAQHDAADKAHRQLHASVR